MCTYARTVYGCDHQAWGRKTKPCTIGQDYLDGVVPSDCAYRKPHGLRSVRVAGPCDRCRQMETKLRETRVKLEALRMGVEVKPAAEDEKVGGDGARDIDGDDTDGKDRVEPEQDSGYDGVVRGGGGRQAEKGAELVSQQASAAPRVTSPHATATIENDSQDDQAAAEQAEKMAKIRATIGQCLQTVRSLDVVAEDAAADEVTPAPVSALPPKAENNDKAPKTGGVGRVSSLRRPRVSAGAGATTTTLRAPPPAEKKMQQQQVVPNKTGLKRASSLRQPSKISNAGVGAGAGSGSGLPRPGAASAAVGKGPNKLARPGFALRK